MISYTLLWLLIVGANGGRSSAVQLGPFIDVESCQRALNVSALKQFDKTCVQVNMLVTPSRQSDTPAQETVKPSPQMTLL